MLCGALRELYAAKDKLSNDMFENISVVAAPLTNSAKITTRIAMKIMLVV